MKQDGIRVIIVEDDPRMRRYLAEAVASGDGLDLIGTAGNLQDGMDLLRKSSPDVLLVDLGLPDGSGLKLIRAARQHSRAIECMVVTIYDDSHHLIRAFESGATGYLLKDSMPEDISRSIHELVHGGSPISPMIARHLLRRFDGATSDGKLVEPLTERERTVLREMSMGLPRKEIASRLKISLHTVHSHVKSIYAKLEVRSNVEAVRKGLRLNLISDETDD
ncbi:MAG: DNA-binding response regulator [Deltaproteobacteria bacterium]|nr:MAG: DNA-binding response regulator [Deltaproteobacteria bacterium]